MCGIIRIYKILGITMVTPGGIPDVDSVGLAQISGIKSNPLLRKSSAKGYEKGQYF